MKVNLKQLTTEQRNPHTLSLDQMDIRECLEIMNEEDSHVAQCVKDEIEHIEIAVKHIISAFQSGGRLIYIGSGTSGRLGVLDAVECPPTFSTTYEVQGLIAGGEAAFIKAQEGVEDNFEQGQEDILNAHITSKDVVVGIAASGRTPHTLGALAKAKELGAYTVALACNHHSEIGKVADIAIEVETGPEVITGSTRLKAGTAQKLVLNMLSTVSMIGIGKVYQNFMVDLYPSNDKLIERSIQMIMEACECDYESAKEVFQKSGQKPKYAIVMQLLNCDFEEANKKLSENQSFVYKAIKKRL